MAKEKSLYHFILKRISTELLINKRIVHKIIFIGLFLLVIGNTVVCAQTEPAALVVKDSEI
jgi:hypothetical protein